ncbi:S-layer homology domain-containing protein [Lysinibacillus piscis]|uniref:SLH domain-containing protein n=1 Tax=Lysinibacillus piscis TaxID=2518931 RepID=A0ABQ5NM46_9BACI|nr:S-layer homology domain-containing protein [Lysinibacillus sp. KH24]GLC89182.1 hypothetical protein LYSBPC_23090 [Lysinibacillus sp. KH24]
MFMYQKLAKIALAGVVSLSMIVPLQAHAYQEPSKYVYTTTTNMTVYSAYGATITAAEKGNVFSIKSTIVNNRQPLEVEIFKNGQGGVLKQIAKKGVVEPVAYRDLGDRVVATIHNNMDLQFVYPQTNYFRDVANSPYQSYITALTERGIVQGKKADYFGVSDQLTRAQVSAFIARAFSFQPVSITQFRDVDSKKSWYGGYVGALHTLGVIRGKTPTIFEPNGKITRQQAVLMLGRTLDAVDYQPEETYSFLNETARHTEILYELGALDNQTVLAPNQLITRGEFAKMLAIVLKEAGRL